jgi:hypothetical protein
MTSAIDVRSDVTSADLERSSRRGDDADRNWLSNHIFSSHDDIVDHCCFAWHNLVDQPWRIMSIGLRNGPIGSDQCSLALCLDRHATATYG